MAPNRVGGAGERKLAGHDCWPATDPRSTVRLGRNVQMTDGE